MRSGVETFDARVERVLGADAGVRERTREARGAALDFVARRGLETGEHHVALAGEAAAGVRLRIDRGDRGDDVLAECIDARVAADLLQAEVPAGVDVVVGL